MAAPAQPTLTFLRGSGFLLSLVGAWDRIPDPATPGAAPAGFILFQDTQVTAVLAHHPTRRRGIEGTYAVQGNRLRFTQVKIDTAPDQGPLQAGEFTLAGDILTIRWDVIPLRVDTFRRRAPVNNGAVLPPVAIYQSEGSHVA